MGLLHELQKEKSYLSRLTKEHIEARLRSEESLATYNAKLKQMRARAEETSKYVSLGKMLQQFIDAYITKSKKKNVNADLLNEVKKYIAKEKAKIESLKKEEVLKKRS